MSGPAVPDLATRLRDANVALEKMESVGSVSDFDDDRDTLFDDSDEDISPISRRLHTHDFDQRESRSSSAWPVWVAAAVVVFGLIARWIMSPSATPTAAEVAQPKIETKQEAPVKPFVVAPATPKPVAAEVVAVKTPQPPKTIAANPPAPVTLAPSVDKPAPLPLPMTPPAPIVAPNPAIMRKALLPSVEEVAKFKQDQVKPQTVPFLVQVIPTAPQQIGVVPT